MYRMVRDLRRVRIATIVAAASLVMCVAILVLSFVDFSLVSAPRWNIGVGVAAALLVPVLIMSIGLARNEEPVPLVAFPFPSVQPFPLRGRRQILFLVIVGLMFVLVAWAAVRGFTSDSVRHDGKYYSRDHGIETEISNMQWESLTRGECRLFSGLVLCFGAVLLTYLTQRPASDDEDDL
jgi:hypothetical protein